MSTVFEFYQTDFIYIFTALFLQLKVCKNNALHKKRRTNCVFFLNNAC